VKFYLDDDLSGRIGEVARKMGVDVTSAGECGYSGQDDAVHLAFAAREGRCLVTWNRDHFIALTVKFFNEEQPHAGVLIVPYSMPSDKFSAIATALTEYDESYPAGVFPYALDFLSPAPT
jgi:predicted nuclease of predicted toxin-antitoxin system